MRNRALAALRSVAFTSGSGDTAIAAVPSLAGRHRVITMFAGNTQRAMDKTDPFRNPPGPAARDSAWLVLDRNKIRSNSDPLVNRSTLEKLHCVDGFRPC